MHGEAEKLQVAAERECEADSRQAVDAVMQAFARVGRLICLAEIPQTEASGSGLGSLPNENPRSNGAAGTVGRTSAKTDIRGTEAAGL